MIQAGNALAGDPRPRAAHGDLRLVSYLRRKGIDCGEVADPFIQSQLDPYGYHAAVGRVKSIGIVAAKATPNDPV